LSKKKLLALLGKKGPGFFTSSLSLRLKTADAKLEADAGKWVTDSGWATYTTKVENDLDH